MDDHCVAELSSTSDISYAVACSAAAQSITDDDKYNVLQHRCPDESCVLPSKACADSRRRSGQTVRQLSRDVFKEFPSVAFSSHRQGVFCTACVLFPTSPENPGAARAAVLIS